MISLTVYSRIGTWRIWSKCTSGSRHALEMRCTHISSNRQLKSFRKCTKILNFRWHYWSRLILSLYSGCIKHTPRPVESGRTAINGEPLYQVHASFQTKIRSKKPLPLSQLARWAMESQWRIQILKNKLPFPLSFWTLFIVSTARLAEDMHLNVPSCDAVWPCAAHGVDRRFSSVSTHCFLSYN